MQIAQLKIGALVLSLGLFAVACSLPSLQSPECDGARDFVKQFYSLYLASDQDERTRDSEKFRKYFTAEGLLDRSEAGIDPSFLSAEWPTTFRIGSCETLDPQTVAIQVQLYWRTDEATTQREIRVEAVKSGDEWKIRKISH